MALAQSCRANAAVLVCWVRDTIGPAVRAVSGCGAALLHAACTNPPNNDATLNWGACATAGTTTSSSTSCVGSCVSGYIGSKVARCELGFWSIVGNTCTGMQQQLAATAQLCNFCRGYSDSGNARQQKVLLPRIRQVVAASARCVCCMTGQTVCGKAWHLSTHRRGFA